MTSKQLDSIVIFGDSITQGGWEPGGFAQKLAYVYARRLDVVNRGLSGYNTEWGLPVFEQIVAKTSEQPHVPTMRLLTIWFGANDACLQQSPQYVSLDRFKANLTRMVTMLRDEKSEWYHPPERTKILFISPPPIDADARAADLASRNPPLAPDRTWDNTKAYADAVKEVGKELSVPVADAWTAIWDAAGHKAENLKQFLPDGLHLNAASYSLVYDLILEAIAQNWPELHYSKLPFVFAPWNEVEWEGDPRPSLQARHN
ncbi:SGNH hydrolase [Exidia glandulosa HHB12029]|uniref:SGNH hydrolase n=1 Tax=Exidia glandulosa HHB12029 TaxID=1314781 RepID=A0A165MCT3_EXIGL|nr:SGNH hydrolase [Exidia glandulosa HHB12029]